MTGSIGYRDAMVNYYVHDVEGMAAFYRDYFGFAETFRTPRNGTAVHIEVRLGHFLLGLASIEAARSMHQLPLDPGKPRSELALWTDDVDEAFGALTSRGVRSISPPHNFIETLRSAWLEDPEGNPIQIVAKLPTGTKNT